MWFHELALRGMCRERRGSVLAYDKYKSLGNEDPAKKKDYKRQHGISKAWLSANLSILCMNTCVVPPKRQELCLHSLNPHPDICASGIMLSLFTYWVSLIPHNILVKSDWSSLLSSWGSVYISIPIFQFLPYLPSPWCPYLFSVSVSLFLFCKQDQLHHFSRFHIFALIHIICFSLSDFLHSIWQSLGSAISLQMTQYCPFLWPSNWENRDAEKLKELAPKLTK